MDYKISLEVYQELHKKFKSNFNTSLKHDLDLLSKVEIKARSIAVLGQIIKNDEGLDIHQQELTALFDEMFSDISLSIYLSSCALDNPAQIQMRKVLELGIAVVYLWDMPHIFWGWKKHDYDLSFGEMLDHIAKEGYRSYLSSFNQQYSASSEILNFKDARRLYRDFSNTVHGKITTFETPLAKRFSHNKEDWKIMLDNCEQVEDILLGFWKVRFFKYFPELLKQIPALTII